MSEFDDYRAENQTSDVLLEWTYDERIPYCVHRWLRLAAAELVAMHNLTRHWRDTYSEMQLQISRLQRLNQQQRDLICIRNEQLLEAQYDCQESQDETQTGAEGHQQTEAAG